MAPDPLPWPVSDVVPWCASVAVMRANREVKTGETWVAVDPRAAGESADTRAESLVVVTIVQGSRGGSVTVTDGERTWIEHVSKLVNKPRGVKSLKTRLFDEQRMIAHRAARERAERARHERTDLIAALEATTRRSVQDLLGDIELRFWHHDSGGAGVARHLATTVTVPLPALQRLVYFAMLWREADPEGWRAHVEAIIG